MSDYDLVIRGGTVVTASDSFRADVGVRDGRIAGLAERLDGARTMDAGGLLVMPGGVDSHCHIEQLQRGGGADEESWTTGSTAALAGGTTSVVTFSTQFKGQPIARHAGRVPPPRRAARWWTTRSTRSSPIPPTRSSRSCPGSSPRAYAA